MKRAGVIVISAIIITFVIRDIEIFPYILYERELNLGNIEIIDHIVNK